MFAVYLQSSSPGTGLQARRRGEWLTGTDLTEAQTVGKKNMADGNPNTNLA